MPCSTYYFSATPESSCGVAPGGADFRTDGSGGTVSSAGDRDLMSACQHDGSISMETAHELSQHRKTGPPDSRPGGSVAVCAEPDGLKRSEERRVGKERRS